MHPPVPDPTLVLAACYERTVVVSLERVWENVLEWEHLPWLHARAFGSIEKLEAGDWGWRAALGGVDAIAGEDPSGSVVELSVDREANRYVVRTEAGMGQGSEIWTRLEVEADERTRITVEFRVPPLPPDVLAVVGRVYVDLYTGLWDEDDEMMRERAERLRELAAAPTPRVVDLGSLETLRTRLPLEVEFAGRPHRVVELEGRLMAHSAVCPHMFGPLFAADGDKATLECPWHGYAFDLRTGRSCDGRGLQLAPAPKVVVDGQTGRCSLVPA